jgi:ATP-binding cassette subfamily B protein
LTESIPIASARTTERLLSYLGAESRNYLLGAAALIATNIPRAGLPYLTKLVFDALEAGEGKGPSAEIVREVGTLALAMVGLAVVMGFFRVASRLAIFNGGRRVEYRLRNDIYAHLQKLGPAFFGRMPVGDLLSRVTNDITAVRLLGGPGILNMVNTVVVYITAIIPMAIISPTLTGWALAPLILVFASTRLVGRRIYLTSHESQRDLAEVSALANETINGIQVVQAYAKEAYRQEGFAAASDRYRKSHLRFVLLRSVLLPILAGTGGLGVLTILYFGGADVIAGRLSLGDFVAVMGYLAMLLWPTVALGWMVSLWQRGRSAMDRVGEILDTEPEVQWTADGVVDPPTDVRGRIEIRGLDFAYPNSDGEPVSVLKDVNLLIEAGETVLLVGPSGAGKSTLVSLLPHLAAVPRGRMLIDDREFHDFPLDVLRRRIAFVPQEPFLFSMTIRENLGFGLDEPTDAAVEAAAAMASLTGDIARFPQGWDTRVGERGVTMSGGQRQRMTIARAAVLHPSIWIFDDCLSSVDAGTEQAIVRNLRSITKDATAIFVTHRLLGFESVDRIIVLKEGRVTEQGTHAELLEARGWYARLYRKQRLDEDLAGPASLAEAG